MKKIISCLFIPTVLVILLYFLYKNGYLVGKQVVGWFSESICETPIIYKIGTVDDKFDISVEELQTLAENGGEMWEDAYGKELFKYDENAKLEINLVYDERQDHLKNIEDLEENVNDRKLDVDKKSKIYDQMISSFEKEMSDLNKKIDYWNSKGGAPKDEYEKIILEQDTLLRKAEKINQYAQDLNKTVDFVNEKINNLNNNVKSFNDLLGENPEMGVYTSGIEKIDIFFYSNEDHLTNVISHELGHALGLGHLDREDALMSPSMTEHTSLTEDDKKLVKDFCTENTKLKVMEKKFKSGTYCLYEYIKSLFNQQSSQETSVGTAF